MPDRQLVASHYTHGSLVDAIRNGLGQLGKTIEQVEVDDLAPVDEFHIGGRIATKDFLDQLGIEPSHHVLDVGCGLGGGSRFAAQRYGCRVTGIDLTPEYVEAGNTLCEWVGLNDRVHLDVEDAVALSFSDDAFDRAFVMHVGMNIEDKLALASELHRVIRPGGLLGVYDIMRVGPGELLFPVPWASTPEGSSVAEASAYKDALDSGGFSVSSERNRKEFALEFFAKLRAKAESADGPAPLGLHILMGSNAQQKMKNLVENISADRLAPIELIARKA